MKSYNIQTGRGRLTFLYTDPYLLLWEEIQFVFAYRGLTMILGSDLSVLVIFRKLDLIRVRSGCTRSLAVELDNRSKAV